MSRRVGTLQPDYFDTLYAESHDPWQFSTSPYEREKYDRTLSILDREIYPSVLEIGCSIGVFTRRLAARSGHLIATEASSRALAVAREALADLRNVVLVGGMIPQAMPAGSFDFVVLSEVLYYLDERDAERAMRLCCDHLELGGEIVLCHWLGETDYPLSGDQAAEIALRIGEERGFEIETLRQPEYRLDHLRNRPFRRGE